MLMLSFSSCSIYGIATPTNISSFSKENIPLGIGLNQFEYEHRPPTTKDVRVENGIKVVELNYVEFANYKTYIKTKFRFEDDKLVSQAQTTEIIQPNVVECKHE